MKFNILLSFTLLIIYFSVFSQKIRYEDRSPVYFGLNTGVTWHTSDVQNDAYNIRGAGFIFGVALNEDYGNAVSFDLRFRGLFGSWRGLDTDTLGFLNQNNALNNAYGEPAGPGFAVQNFRASQAHWAFELAVHANSLRERTGIDPYLFGGISFTSTFTQGDLFNSSGGLYDYAGNPSGSLIENTYNTGLDANANGEIYDDFVSSVLPTFGFGIGYYITNRFSIGLEHKSTFFNNNYFDGTPVNQDGVIDGRNDVYHYTGAYLRLNLKAREANESTVKKPTPPPTNNVNAYTRGPEQNREAPVVEFTSPSSSPFQTNVETITLRANIQHVNKAQNIRFTQDGITNHDFTFNSLSNRFQSTVQLKPGQNVFNVRGSNDYGVDNDQIVIVFSPIEQTPTLPTVKITDPSNNPHVTNEESRIVKATIQNVSTIDKVTFSLNGQAGGKDFTFSPNGVNNFSVSVPLNIGANVIKVTGSNQYGTASDEVIIIYERKPEAPSIEPPVVEYKNPTNSPITVNDESFNIIGSVLNVDGKNQITFKQNGSINANFTYNTSSKKFISNVKLTPGANFFQLIGTNSAGTDQKTVIINYDIPSPTPPIVNITNPSSNPHSTTSSNQSLVATVLNIDNSSQIEMKLNGVNFSQFSFNTNTSVLTSVLPLQVGPNVVSIKGTNKDGTDMKQTTILYRKPLLDPPPVVNFIQPTSNPFTSYDEKETVMATVDNVTQKSQINVNINGSNTSNFNFSSSNGVVQLDADLILGANTVTITGTNAVGSDSKSTTILYRKPKEEHPPVVTYLDPNVNPITVYNSSYKVRAKVDHVGGSHDISLSINGNSTSQFTYSTTSNIMEFTTSLLNGANLIQITGTNAYGQDTETTTIVYQKIDPVLPPVVTITTPTPSTYTVSSASTPIVATVLNVNGKNDINVIVNGNSITSFSYNTSSKVLNFNMALNEGSNEVIIVGANNTGTAQDNRTIIYNLQHPVEPPLVTYINPANSGKEVAYATFNLKATVDNVDSKNDIVLKFDGQVISANNYSFNVNSKELNYLSNLSFGNNTFEIKGTNSAGTHQANTNVVYHEPKPDCDEPSVAFINPSQNNLEVTDSEYTFKALVHNVAGINQITLKLNGQDVGNFSYSLQSHELTRKLNLEEGNNIVEIRVLTDCGVASVSRIIKYSSPAVPCEDPEINLMEPHYSVYNTQNEELTVFATVSNIDNVQQIQFIVNGSSVNFSYDVGTHTISSNVPLQLGVNNVKIIATNACGSVYDQWKITREKCSDPIMVLTSSPTGNKISSNELTISGSISEVSTQSIIVKLNNTTKSFNYDQNSQNFSSSLTLNEGVNVIEISATNNCGNTTQKLNITYEPVVVVNPPTVNITSPSSSPHATQNGSYDVIAAVTNVSSSNQLSVTVNNVPYNFSFDQSNQKVLFNVSLTEGNNVIEIVAVNDGGMDNDTKTIVYSKPVVINPPVVMFVNPSSEVTEKEDGMYNITGTVTNLTNNNQLKIFVNQNEINNVLASVTPGGISFSFNVTVSSSHDIYELTAEGTNTAGSDSKTIFINRHAEEEEEAVNCMAIVSASFTSDAKSMTAMSDKDLSNVVLKYSDHTTQKFEGLSGNTQTFSGTGKHQDKCIVGAWIKSGCYLSGDGPGYGEFIQNTSYDGRCENTPCETPVITVQSPNSVESQSYALVFSKEHIQANEVGVTFNNAPINCSYNANDQVFTCNVDLKVGNNTFIITADGCETTTVIHDVNYTVPCKPIAFQKVFPSGLQNETTDKSISVNLTVQEVTISNISATLNGSTVVPALSGNSLILQNLNLNEGANRLIVQLSNDCSNETVNYTIVYKAAGACGPRINPGNSDWQFCLVTPSGTFNRNDLQDPNFTYKGPASSLYFLPIAGGGNASLNGSPVITIQAGRYYLFEGNLTVEVSSQNPSSMGHWMVCVDSDSNPQSGNGNNRPASPCESNTTNIGKPKPTGTQSSPGAGQRTIQTQPKPTGTNKPTNITKPSTTTKPSTITRPTTTTTTRTTRTNTGATSDDVNTTRSTRTIKRD